MAEKKKSKLGAKAIFARILAVILVTAIGGVARKTRKQKSQSS